MFLISESEDGDEAKEESAIQGIFLSQKTPQNVFTKALLGIIHFSANSSGQLQHRH